MNKIISVSVDFKTENRLMDGFSTQDEYKKLEESEKKSREALGENVDGLIYDVDRVVEHRENPESQKMNIEMDEL